MYRRNNRQKCTGPIATAGIQIKNFERFDGLGCLDCKGTDLCDNVYCGLQQNVRNT